MYMSICIYYILVSGTDIDFINRKINLFDHRRWNNYGSYSHDCICCFRVHDGSSCWFHNNCTEKSQGRGR